MKLARTALDWTFPNLHTSHLDIAFLSNFPLAIVDFKTKTVFQTPISYLLTLAKNLKFILHDFKYTVYLRGTPTLYPSLKNGGMSQFLNMNHNKSLLINTNYANMWDKSDNNSMLVENFLTRQYQGTYNVFVNIMMICT